MSVALPPDQMRCPECGAIAESDSVDVGVGLIVRGNFACICGWEAEADGRCNVETYEDWFVDIEMGAAPFAALENGK